MPDKDKGHPLEENPNWKGGRTITSHGYVLLKRPDHPNADDRGYVYEHRLVAAEKLGRPIRSDEHVHHKNGDKQDNRPENLEVLTIEEHRARHRDSDELRYPGEPNPTIECACGCGATLKKYDPENRPREYIHAHNVREQDAPVQEAVLAVLDDGPASPEDLVEETGRTPGAVKSALQRLRDQGSVENPRRGYWKLPEHELNLDSPTYTERVESDEEIKCACGCGETLTRYDEYGREREYISGHNPIGRDSQVQDDVLAVLQSAGGVATRAEINNGVEATDSEKSIGSALRTLRDAGLVEDGGYGKWKLSQQAHQKIEAMEQETETDD